MIMSKEFGLELSAASTAEFQMYPENKGRGFTTSANKRSKLSLPNNQQAEDLNSYQSTSPLGLTLRKTPSFLNLLEMALSQAKTEFDSFHPSTRNRNEANMNDLSRHQYGSEKLKASNFSALSIKIGSFERSSRYEEELIAKCYYAKKKIVWELLEGPVKSKMEIQWSDIEAIRATTHGNEPGILEIELNQPPLFFKETNPQPRKHTLWQQTSDFTGGQAIKCRRHTVHFPPNTLDKHYEKLLQCDRRLFELSQKPFPSSGFPYFQQNFYPRNISFGRQYANISTPFVQTHHPNLTTDLDQRHQDGSDNVSMFINQGEESWTNENNGYVTENQTKELPAIMNALETQWGIDPNVAFDIKNENVLVNNMQFTTPDREGILATESSICSFVDSQDGLNDMTSQVLHNNFMMANYYGLSNVKGEPYERLHSSYVDY